jgi:hypothetical protein
MCLRLAERLVTDARSTEVAAGDHPDKAATPAATRARLDPDIAARLQQFARGPDTGATFHKAYATALASLDADEQGEVAAMLPEAVMGARLGVGGEGGEDGEGKEGVRGVTSFPTLQMGTNTTSPYSSLSSLSDDIVHYENTEFEFLKVPIPPPPKELCYWEDSG